MLVSHDRQFVDNTVTECWIFEGGGRIGQYVGGYHDARGQQAQSLAQKQTVVKKTTEVAQPKAETVKRGGNKLSYNLQRELEQLPQKLEARGRTADAAGSGCRSRFLRATARSHAAGAGAAGRSGAGAGSGL